MNSLLSRSEIEELIAQGRSIVIYRNLVLNVDKWIKYHPGGDKAIFHMIGRDATAEMDAYHSNLTIATFKKWRIGVIDYPWENMVPPIQGGVYRLAEKMDQLSETSDDTVVDIEPDENFELKPRREDSNAGGVSVDLNEAFAKQIIFDPVMACDKYHQDRVRKDMLQYPSVDQKTQGWVTKEYYKTHQQIIDAGLYKCDYFSYVKELARIGLLLFLSFHLLYKWDHKVLSALLLACVWQQAVFIAHDAGHVSITHNYQLDNIFGMIIASALGGLSLGWWKRNHNVHHLVTNDPNHDPDIQHLPFFAVSTLLFKNVYSTYYDRVLKFDSLAEKLIPFQHYFYYPLLAFGRFNLYVLSWKHVLLGQGPRHGTAAWFRYFELCGLIFFNYWFTYLIICCKLQTFSDRLIYILVSHFTTMIVHVQITLSHFAMSTSDLGIGESFPQKQLRTSMDIDCPRWIDFFHGGLQFQVVHHLFPRLPRHNLRAAQPYVVKFCERVGIKYSIYGFSKSNRVVLSHLQQIAQQAKTMVDCVKTI
ncbi:fatty acid desaturase Ecym_2214 [Eremothecium cymbalariae DBVPG|uniref:Delta 8-(E)-sphingolipid desaturase n=1 Tax=Eremothecium cymbalariae (strain CBS 270.75 / DBVPG 7215 / KCTC 17166 / NRRL Y-17582) TaxID=931890 RepID=G8JP58_ERECY|nr:Hypothetical protein Ecym_2214 [Eremothecium cymbalariae DBVPG\